MQKKPPSRGSRDPSPSRVGALFRNNSQNKLPNINNSYEIQTQPLNGKASVDNLMSGLAYGVCSEQGKRPYQEDEYALRPNLNKNGDSTETHYFGLYDGHAGGRCSKYVSSTLPDIFSEDPAFHSSIPTAIKRAYHTTNELFLKIADKLRLHDGSTGITSILRDGKLTVANVGDCRALVISNGRPIQVSFDQKPTLPEEQRRIASLGGTVLNCMGVARVNGVLAVSRAFGNRMLKQVIRPDAELTVRELTRDDEYLVMASDGMWDVLRNKDVADTVNSLGGFQPSHIAEELVHLALARGSMDNVTCIVVRLKEYVLRSLSSAPSISMPKPVDPIDSDSPSPDITATIQVAGNEDAFSIEADLVSSSVYPLSRSQPAIALSASTGARLRQTELEFSNQSALSSSSSAGNILYSRPYQPSQGFNQQEGNRHVLQGPIGTQVPQQQAYLQASGFSKPRPSSVGPGFRANNGRGLGSISQLPANNFLGASNREGQNSSGLGSYSMFAATSNSLPSSRQSPISFLDGRPGTGIISLSASQPLPSGIISAYGGQTLRRPSAQRHR